MWCWWIRRGIGFVLFIRRVDSKGWIRAYSY